MVSLAPLCKSVGRLMHQKRRQLLYESGIQEEVSGSANHKAKVSGAKTRKNRSFVPRAHALGACGIEAFSEGGQRRPKGGSGKLVKALIRERTQR